MNPKEEFEKLSLDLRMNTATLENLQGQIFDGSYRKGSLLCFRAMVLQKELKDFFEEDKYIIFKEQVAEIDVFVKEIIKSPNIFGSLFQ